MKHVWRPSAFGLIGLVLAIAIMAMLAVMVISMLNRQTASTGGNKVFDAIEDAEEASQLETERLRDIQKQAEKLKETVEQGAQER